jgi:hypothetical protein
MYKQLLLIIVGLITGIIQIGFFNSFGHPPLLLLPLIVLITILIASHSFAITGFSIALGIIQDMFSPLPFGVITGSLIVIGVCVHVLHYTVLSNRSLFSIFGIGAASSILYLSILEIVELLMHWHKQLPLTNFFSVETVIRIFVSSCITGICIMVSVTLLSFSPKYRLKPHIVR